MPHEISNGPPMVLIDDLFIGHPSYANQELDFLLADTEDAYQSNKSNIPNWAYTNRKITYCMNRFGHRSKDITDINLKNYILCTGCSHTMGSGLALEDTYAYLLSRELSCDYYNLATSATGIDVLQFNLISWLLKVNRHPKAVIVQVPEATRFVTMTDDNKLNVCGSWSTTFDGDMEKFVTSGEDINYFNSRLRLFVHLLRNLSNTKTVFFSLKFPFNQQYEFGVQEITVEDGSRDLMHPGMATNRKIKNFVLDQLSD